MRTSIALLIVAVVTISCATCPRPESGCDLGRPPADVKGAIDQLKARLPPEVLEEFASASQHDATVGAHFGLGLTIRNCWCLWGDSRLAQFFFDEGIDRPDDMSGVILVSLWRNLNGQPINLEGQVECLQRWAAEASRLRAEALRLGNNSWPTPDFSCPP